MPSVSEVRTRLREVMARPACIEVPNIYDPLSANIAQMMGFEVCKLSGSVSKFSNLGFPDDTPMSNGVDLAELCRRLTRAAAGIAFIVDVDDGFGNAFNVRRTVQEVEQAGIAGMELEDNLVPPKMGVPNPGVVPKEEHLLKLKAALEARRDPATVISCRTAALTTCSLEEALDRIGAYAETGIDMLMLTGLRENGRGKIEAVHKVTSLPLTVLFPTADVHGDRDFCVANNVKFLYRGQAAYAMAVKAIYTAFQQIQDGKDIDDLKEWCPPEILRQVNHTDEYIRWQEKYVP